MLFQRRKRKRRKRSEEQCWWDSTSRLSILSVIRHRRRVTDTTVTRHPFQMPKRNNTTNNSEPKKRCDNFWYHTDASNAEYFNSILRNKHDLYKIDRNADVNMDYNRRKRGCWKLMKKTGEMVTQLRSTRAYRLSTLWAVSNLTRFFHKHPAKRKEMIARLPDIKTKRGDHTRHRCPNNWCCNPGHFQIGERKMNETDKHFHYFLKLTEDNVSTKFLDCFRDLCRKQRVFGICK